MATTHQNVWPLGKNLVAIRGHLSVSKAALKVGVDRQTWTAWEQCRQRPKYEMLKAIVEAFDCPPELVGYEPPLGWVLVPEEWITAEFADQRRRHEELLTALQPLHDAAGTGITLVPARPSRPPQGSRADA